MRFSQNLKCADNLNLIGNTGRSPCFLISKPSVPFSDRCDVELSIIEFAFRGDPDASLSVSVDKYVHRDESNRHAVEKIPKSERVHTGTRESKKVGQ